MKRRKEVKDGNLIFSAKSIKVSKEINNELFFEINNNITSDIAEAVSIMIINNIKGGIWDIEISNTTENIDPEKSLYWLSGGDKEWSTLEHYSKPWINCYMDFQEEFGFMVIKILNKSKTLGDIKDGFIKYLNLPTIYDFAISKGLVR